MDKRRRCSDGLEHFQCRLTIRGYTNVFLWSVLKLNFIDTGQDNIYLSLENCCVSTQGKDYPKAPAPVPSFVLDPSVYQTSPLTSGGAPKPLVQSSLVNILTLYLGSRLNAGLTVSTPVLKMGSDCWSCFKILLCPLLGCRYDQHPRLQRWYAANLDSLCTTNSTGGRQMSASMVRVGVVLTAPVIPKQANLWILLSFFLALAVWQPGHHTKDAKVMDSLMTEI